MNAPREQGKIPSRWDEWKEANGETPPVPDLGPLAFYGTLFMEMGRVRNNGMGLEPTPWAEIEAFARAAFLDPEDIRILRAMSVAYLAEYKAGDDALRLPPWNGEPLWPT